MPSLPVAYRCCPCAYYYILRPDCWLIFSRWLRSVGIVLQEVSSPASTCARAAASGRSTRPSSSRSVCSSLPASRFWPGSRSRGTDWWSCAVFGCPSLPPLRTTCSAWNRTRHSIAFSRLVLAVLAYLHFCEGFFPLLHLSMNCPTLIHVFCYRPDLCPVIFYPVLAELLLPSTLQALPECALRCLAPPNWHLELHFSQLFSLCIHSAQQNSTSASVIMLIWSAALPSSLSLQI